MNLSAINSATKGKVRTTGVSPFLELELHKIYPNPNQPRKSFNDIDELAASISTNGLIQPIAVVKVENKYMIISGERRFRACETLELKTIKAHIIVADEKKILELALVENIQRDDLTDFEKAKFINQLWASGNYEQKQDLATAIGKSPSYISKVLKTVNLSKKVIEDLEKTKRDIGLEILQELSSVKNEEAQFKLYDSGAKRDDIRDYLLQAKANNEKYETPKISPAKKEYKQTQLYAMIKKSSKHYGQSFHHTDNNGKPAPFEIYIPTSNNNDRSGEAKGGVGGNYYLNELDIYIKLNGCFINICGS